MFKVTFSFEDGSVVEAFANAGDNLLEVARGANVAIDAPCSGNGACGKCRVQLKSGELESKKTLHISDEEYQEGWRLACCSKISADVNVLVPDIASAYKSRMKVADLSSKEEIAIFENAKRDVELAGIELKNSLEVVDVTMDPPSLDDTMPDNERLTRALRKYLNISRVRIPYCGFIFTSQAASVAVLSSSPVNETSFAVRTGGNCDISGRKRSARSITTVSALIVSTSLS